MGGEWHLVRGKVKTFQKQGLSISFLDSAFVVIFFKIMYNKTIIG